MILIRRVVAQNIHIEPGTFLDHGQADPPGADDGHSLARHFVSEKRQIRMPVAPLVFPRQVFRRPHFSSQRAHHEKRKFRGGFGKHVRGVGERNLVAIGIGAVDVVEAHGDLRHNFQRPFARLKHFGVDWITQRGDQPIHPGLHFLDDDALRRRFRLGIYFDVVSPLAQQFNRFTDIASRKHPKFPGHSSLESES